MVEKCKNGRKVINKWSKSVKNGRKVINKWSKSVKKVEKHFKLVFKELVKSLKMLKW
jgi:hypothetical protein